MLYAGSGYAMICFSCMDGMGLSRYAQQPLERQVQRKGGNFGELLHDPGFLLEFLNPAYMTPGIQNLFTDSLAPDAKEHFLTLVQTESIRVERIISNGQCSPKDFWYDQEENEWVLLVAGAATLEFEDGGKVELKAGDYLVIECHVRHRVDQVSADAVWVAVFYR